ncbi:unnamed protein product [Ilex paraguariensis]|uniref:Uncharacterized protein n=1 Tax=Ilex paraguariensis TaxID=185542 RepID=A0ABC8RS62_9AQUA
MVPGSPKRIASRLLDSVASLWAVCTKRASRAKRILTITDSNKSPAAKPKGSKKIFAAISNKEANSSRHKKWVFDDEEFVTGGGFGDGGLWQRNILMGDKCQPLDFPGVIYYDSNGKRLNELPMKSPRASPLPNNVYPPAAK